MKKTLLILPLLMLGAATVSAQDAEKKSPWTHSGLAGINYSQSSFINWSEGGDNSMAGNVYLNASLNYTDDKQAWTNDLDANFGLNRNASVGEWRKNVDNLHFASKYGRTMAGKFYYAALADFKTQFANGYNYGTEPKSLMSKFMTPAYLNLSVGIDYKPNEHLSAYLSPVAGKMTYVTDSAFSKSFGVASDKLTRWELGATFKASVNYVFFEKLTVKSDVDLFTPYNQSFGNIDVNWNVLLGLSVTNYITVTFQSNLKYDDDIKTYDELGNVHGAKVQWKEMLGVGLSVKF